MLQNSIPLSYMTVYKFIFFTILLSILAKFSYAQLSPPLLSGNVSINMKDGLIKADLKLSNLPALDTGYRILLNQGMNVKYLRDSTGVLRYNSSLVDNFFKYRVHNGKAYLPIPKTLQISYTGAFPVYTDTLNFSDYKGIIALNGKTLRASEQSKWYPVIYDVKNDREISEVSYDIQINCSDCKTIYLNGQPAKAGPVARFTSSKAFELLLFTGEYDKQEFSGSDFINAAIPNDIAEKFNEQIMGIKAFYEKVLKLPYEQKITFLQHKAIEPYGPNRSWGFVTFPTIAVAGGQFNSQIDAKTGKFNHMVKYSFYSHELGHYYFGSVLSPNSTLKWFFLESMAEYLSIKATEKEYGKDSTASYINFAKKQLASKKIIPLSKVTDPEQIDEVYRYNYGPLILLTLEKRIGEAKVYKLLQTILKHKGVKTDYAFLVSTAIESGIQLKEWKQFEEQIIEITDASAIFSFLADPKR